MMEKDLGGGVTCRIENRTTCYEESARGLRGEGGAEEKSSVMWREWTRSAGGPVSGGVETSMSCCQPRQSAVKASKRYKKYSKAMY